MQKSFQLFKRRAIEKQHLERLTQRIEKLEKEKRQREQSDNSLKHHLRLLDVLLNTIPSPVFYQDNDGILQGCNPSFAGYIFSLPRETLLGQSIADLSLQLPRFFPENLFRPPVNQSPKPGPIQTEGCIHCADNQQRDFLITKAAIVESDGKFSGSVGVMIDITARKKAEVEKEKLINELQEALATVKTLSGLLPICSHCKKIRDDKGYWNQIESYIEENSDAEFSHSICKECAQEHYPDMDIYDD